MQSIGHTQLIGGQQAVHRQSNSAGLLSRSRQGLLFPHRAAAPSLQPNVAADAEPDDQSTTGGRLSQYVRQDKQTYASPSITDTGSLRPKAEWFPAWMRYKRREDNYVFWQDKFSRNSLDIAYEEKRWTLFSTLWFLVMQTRFYAIPPAVRYVVYLGWRAFMEQAYQAHKKLILFQCKTEAWLAARAIGLNPPLPNLPWQTKQQQQQQTQQDTDGNASASQGTAAGHSNNTEQRLGGPGFSLTMALRRLHWRNSLLAEALYLLNVYKSHLKLILGILGSQPGHMPQGQPMEKQRLKPMFQEGTVHWAAEVGDITALDNQIKSCKSSRGWPESVTLQQKEDLLGMMPIHIAAEKGHLECVQYLIQKRVDLDAGDKFRVTALHLAAIENQEQVVEVLLASQANPRQPDVDGDTPIHWAATKGHCGVIKQLFKAGAQLDPGNKIGWTPLHRAAYNGRRAACEELVRLGASLSARNKDGNTPLHLAAYMNQLSTMETLLGLSARTDSVNDHGQAPLDMCITDAARDIIADHSATSRATPQATAGPTTYIRDPELAADIERYSNQMKNLSLSAALKNRAKASEEFPEPGEDIAPQQQQEGSSTLYMRPALAASGSKVASDFLYEASSGFDDKGNPYAQGYGREDDRSSRASVSSSQDRSSVLRNSNSMARQQSSQGRALDRNSSMSTSHRVMGGSGVLATKVSAGMDRNSGGNLRGRHSVPVAQVSPKATPADAPSWEGAERESASDYQERVREANRKAAMQGATGASLLTPAGALSSPRNQGPAATAAAAGAKSRPKSGNKKFLEGYGLDKFNLFAPS